MAKIYDFQEILEARQREDYLEFRNRVIQTTIADIEEIVVEVSTEVAYKWMQAHLGMDDMELAQWLEEVEGIVETEKPNT